MTNTNKKIIDVKTPLKAIQLNILITSLQSLLLQSSLAKFYLFFAFNSCWYSLSENTTFMVLISILTSPNNFRKKELYKLFGVTEYRISQ